MVFSLTTFKKTFPLLMLAVFATPLQSVMATETSSIPLYIWDNQEGLKTAQNCTVIPVEEARFKVSQYFGNKKSDTENLRNKNGVRQSHLINGSLIKSIDGAKKSNYEYVEVVGVNQDSNVATTRWFSERLDKGYLFDRSIEPIEDYVIQVKEVEEGVRFEGLFEQKVEGTYWKVLADQHYLGLKCIGQDNARDYLVFHVYDKEKANGPIARVGVYWDETNIFKSIETISSSKALEFLPTLQQDERLDLIMEEANVLQQESGEVGVKTEEVETESEEEEGEEADVEISSDIEIETDESLNANKDGQVPTLMGLENVVCTSSSTLNVRNENLDEVIFKARQGEKVKVFQTFEEDTKETEINGKKHLFVRVQFAEREESDQVSGWVAAEYVKTKEECPYTNGSVIQRNSDTQISGLDDPKCCEFPTMKKVTHSFTSGMRRFNAGRSKGKRLHAACDLYRYKDEPIMAVAPGTVVRDRYYFYEGTYALEVRHSGGFIVRYGELTGKNVSGVSKNRSVKMGDRLGYIGVVNSGCCRPMLHFELYRGNRKGALTTKTNRYQRRSDLMDPTPYLLRWQSEKF